MAVFVATMAAVATTVGGLAVNPATAEARWPGPLDAIRRYPWPFFGIAVVLGTVAAVAQRRLGHARTESANRPATPLSQPPRLLPQPESPPASDGRIDPRSIYRPAEFFSSARRLYAQVTGGMSLRRFARRRGLDSYDVKDLVDVLSDSPRLRYDDFSKVGLLLESLGKSADTVLDWEDAWDRAWANRGPTLRAIRAHPVPLAIHSGCAAVLILYGAAINQWSAAGRLGAGNVVAFIVTSLILMFLLLLGIAVAMVQERPGIDPMVLFYLEYDGYFVVRLEHTGLIAFLISVVLCVVTAIAGSHLGLAHIGHVVRDWFAWRF